MPSLPIFSHVTLVTVVLSGNTWFCLQVKRRMSPTSTPDPDMMAFVTFSGGSRHWIAERKNEIIIIFPSLRARM